jgi:2-hydroxy-6-oxonona-2,4-dienedioate hydrolase
MSFRVAGGTPAATSRRIAVDGLGVHTWVAGRGQPVVLVHGYGVSGRYMLPLAGALAESFSVYTLDLPGFGRSDKPPAPLGIDGLAVALASSLDALGLERPVFVANSLGCQIVTELAVRRPERVGPLALIGPTVDPEQRKARRQVFNGLRDAAREPLSLLAVAARDDAVCGGRTLLATARSALADRIEERLPLIEQPTLVLRGEKDGFVGAGWAEQVAGLLPSGRLVVVPDEPHAVHYTRPELVADIVRDLLLEESEQARGELVGSFPHRDVPAWEPDEPRPRQSPMPLFGNPGWGQPILLAPDEE